jgi:hypothetical protein
MKAGARSSSSLRSELQIADLIFEIRNNLQCEICNPEGPATAGRFAPFPEKGGYPRRVRNLK